MKKLGFLTIILFLTACNRMTGSTITTCFAIDAGLVGDGVGQTMLEIIGRDEEIIIWTVNTTLTRAEFDVEFLDGIYLSDEEIHDLFARYNANVITGAMVLITELTSEIVTITKIYNYENINNEQLSLLWGVDDFSDAVTLSSAIEGLMEQGANCATVTANLADDDE